MRNLSMPLKNYRPGFTAVGLGTPGGLAASGLGGSHGPDMGLATLVASVAGVLTGIYLVVLDTAALAAAAEARPPLPVGLRLVGSWIAAVALMLFAFSLSRVQAA